MTKNKLLNSESGIAHLVLVFIVLVVLGVTGFAAYTVVSSNNELADEQDTTTSEVADDSSIDTDADDSDKSVATETSSDLEAENANN